MSESEVSTPRRLGRARALAELHYRLRTEGGTPVHDALSVGLGVAIGCLPLYGLHLALCAGLATLFRLGRIKCYLAAHINNPLTAPVLLYLELGVGSWLASGRWTSLAPRALESKGLAGVGRDLALGSLAVGLLLGVVAALVTWRVSGRAGSRSAYDRLVERAARPYLELGIRHWEFVRAKLRHDPLYRALLESGRLPATGRLIDLGCGRGIVLALVAAARETESDARLDEPALELLGVERRARTVAVARAALAERATIVEADLAAYRPPAATVVLILDVLHYLPREIQERVLERAAEALTPGGRLIVREPDAAMGWRFRMTRVAERLRAIARGTPGQRFSYRAAVEWRARLEALGLTTEEGSMWRGTPFGNRVIVGTRPGESGPLTEPGPARASDS